MKEIQLTQGQVAKVCDCHYHLVKDYKWHAVFNSDSKYFYAGRRLSKEEHVAGEPDHIAMHRVINNTPKGYVTDHINHDTLDNRCCNLRTASIADNGKNRRKNRDNTTGYRGVSWSNMLKKYQVRIQANGKRKTLGFFNTKDEAKQAREQAERELFGEFVNTES